MPTSNRITANNSRIDARTTCDRYSNLNSKTPIEHMKPYKAGFDIGKTIILPDDDFERLSEISRAIYGNWKQVNDPVSIIPKPCQETVYKELAKYPRSQSDFICGVLDGLIDS